MILCSGRLATEPFIAAARQEPARLGMPTGSGTLPWLSSMFFNLTSTREPVLFSQTNEGAVMRRWRGALMAGVLVFAGACGSDSSDDGATGKGKQTPIEAVLASSTKTTEAKSSKVAFTVVTQGAQGAPGGSITITGEGAFDYVARQGAFTMNIPAVGGMQIGQLEAVSAGSTTYLKYPPQLAAVMGGKPWVKIDPNQLGQGAGLDFGSSAGDPSQSLQMLKGAGDDMVEVGKEEVRGEAVTHYRGTIDMNKAATAAPPEQQQTYQKLAQMYGQPVPMDVWIDGEGRLRKTSSVLDLAKFSLPPQATAGGKPTGITSSTIELFDFGTAVSVTVPPADQMSDLSQLLAAAGGGR